jgi:N-acetylmuramoyl-L-alanine amidase
MGPGKIKARVLVLAFAKRIKEKLREKKTLQTVLVQNVHCADCDVHRFH